MGDDASRSEPPPGMTLFAWVKSSLRATIARGEYMPDEPFVTQREIVERFGVSTTTAVRALNDLVAEGVVVRRRGRGTFVAEPATRDRPSGEPSSGVRTVAYVSLNDVDAHQVKIRSGIAEGCAEHDYRLVVSSSRDVDSEPDVLRRVVAEGAHGVIAYLHDHSRVGPTLQELRRSGVAVVLVDRYLPSIPSDVVVFDDFSIGYEVTRAVLDRGHRSPVVLWGEEDVTSVRDRLSGHYRALRDRGQPELANMDELGPYDVSPLAVVSATLPAREMGATAFRLLHERMTGSDEPMRHVVLPARVHVAEPGHNRLSVTGSRPAVT